MELHTLPAHELRTLLEKREVSSVEIVKSLLERIEEVDAHLGSYLTVRADAAIAEAEEADRRIAAGDRGGPLLGIPVSLGDNLSSEGIATTCASTMLEGYVPPFDATVVARLKRAGALILGKLNMDEFGLGSSNENSALKPARNPWDSGRVPGGSSGGAAAAVAAGAAVAALGSDAGGSIRQPASYCGVVGVKPTYGRVSRYGLIASAPSLDQVGPVAKDVRDAALLLQAIAGHDELDSTSSAAEAPPYSELLEGGVKGLRFGLPREFFGEEIAPDVKEAVLKAARLLEESGAKVEELSLPHARYALPSFILIASAEASSNLGRFDGVRYGLREEADDVISMFKESRRRGFGPEVKRCIALGTYVLSSGQYDAYYLKALKVRTLIRRDFDEAFERCDLILAPTTPTTAFKIGERRSDPLAMYQSNLCTVAANLAGLPALSLPCGRDREGLPIGLQLLAPAFDEATLLRAAYAYEQAAGWRRTIPQVEV